MKEEFTYFGEAWNFFKRFYEIREDDACWDAVVAAGGEIMRQYDPPLCGAVVGAITEELEKKSRGIQKMKQNAT